MQQPRPTKRNRSETSVRCAAIALGCIVVAFGPGCGDSGRVGSAGEPLAEAKTFARPAAGPRLPLDRASHAGSADGRISGALEALAEHARSVARGALEPLPPGLDGLRVLGDSVLVDGVAEADGALLERDLERIGLRAPARVGRVVSGFLPVAAIAHARGLGSLRALRPSWMSTHAGAAANQGDAAMNADAARETFGVDGRGVAVGILSDSFDCLGGASGDVASGDLPPGVRVLADEPGCGSGTDEGRAMLQLVHDVAPGSALLFHTAFGGIADLALGIGELADAGATVIADDVIYFAEPMFQDGLLANAVDRAHARGVSYFSSAGNAGRASYEGAFRASGTTVFGDGEAHDFDPGKAVDTALTVEIPTGELAFIVLQWSEPFFSVSGAPGSRSDLHLYLTDDPPTKGLAASRDANVGGDPVEILAFENTARGRNGGTRFNVVIEGVKGPTPLRLKLVFHPYGVRALEHATESSTLYGHANARGASAICAVPFYATPAFGVSPPLLEVFSSAGGTPILFDRDGAPMLDERPKPDVCAPDGANTTFFGFDVDADADAFPNFFGTSAAAPNAAAVAALLRSARPELPPDEVRDALAGSALDVGVPGFDADSGHGLLRADVALELAAAAEIPPVPTATAAPGEADGGAGPGSLAPGEAVVATGAGSSRGCSVRPGDEGVPSAVPLVAVVALAVARRRRRHERRAARGPIA